MPREIIEKFGMSRGFAARAEVIGCADDALAKMVEPDAIHQHARRQRIVLARYVLRQLQPAAALLERRRVARRKNAQKMARHNGTAIAGVALDEHVGIL